ncbi:MAG: WecB/TagA/CpsF family glycosyltransferase [Bacteroidales bacterium]|nr:WecB/TagA/CpsF family glycosyltransferase [Bacteroidales bacterium]
MNNLNILNFKIDTTLDPADFDQHQVVVNTINPHSYCLTKSDNAFWDALQKSDVLIPDGMGIVWAAKFLTGEKIKRIPGADLHRFLLARLNEGEGRVFYFGSSDETLKKIEARLKREYPRVKFGGYSPPYKEEFTEQDSQIFVKTVNKFKPDVVFIGMTAPKQEKWVQINRERIDANVIASIGAVFDFYAGTKKRARKFYQDIGMEWFPRFVREPRRLWKRVFISDPVFIFDVLKYKFIRGKHSSN